MKDLHLIAITSLLKSTITITNTTTTNTNITTTTTTNHYFYYAMHFVLFFLFL